jgi:hypothetical protein
VRRWFRPLVVSILCLTLSVDTAKACWFLRRCHRGRAARPACACRCVPADTVLPCDAWCGPDSDLAPAGAVEVVDVEVTSPAPQAEPQAAASLEPRGDGVVVHGPTVIAGEAAKPRRQPQPAPTEATTAAQQPGRPAATPAEPLLPVPASDERPDEPAVATAAAETPMPEPAAAVEPKPTSEPNLFDLYGDEVEMEADESAAPGETEMTEEDEAESEEPAPDEAAEATEKEPAEEAAADTAESAGDEPAEPPQTDADTAMIVPGEPLRRWTDATATHEARGWLVAIGADRVRILKVNGRHATVAIDALSAADRDYVSAVGTALAAAGDSRPAANTTARR